MKVYAANWAFLADVDAQNDDREPRYLIDEAEPVIGRLFLNQPVLGDGIYLNGLAEVMDNLKREVLEPYEEDADDENPAPKLDWVAQPVSHSPVDHLHTWRWFLLENAGQPEEGEPEAILTVCEMEVL